MGSDPAARDLLASVEEKLASDAEDAERFDEHPPSEAAKAVCRSLVRTVAGIIGPDIMCGVFTEDSGGISLTLQSRATGRRLTFRIPADGGIPRAMATSEENTSLSLYAQHDDEQAVKKLAEWVAEQAKGRCVMDSNDKAGMEAARNEALSAQRQEQDTVVPKGDTAELNKAVGTICKEEQMSLVPDYPELKKRFTYHPPTPDMVPVFRMIREKALELAVLMSERAPFSRELSLAQTKLEEVVMWVNASIARNGLRR